jgi:hypothetical protein
MRTWGAELVSSASPSKAPIGGYVLVAVDEPTAHQTSGTWPEG